ncbi:MAG: Fe-S cluster assembly protein SufD [Deltaproteobacteria bacterium]|nr:Fe-S cluster assembly protein SufD [Deltaproteobacteria bacterium]
MTTIATTTADTVAKWAAGLGEPAWLINQRKAAWEAYLQLSPPPNTEEAWKYTDLSKIGWDRLAVLPNGSGTPTGTITTTFDVVPKEFQARGVIVSELSAALSAEPDLVRPYLTDPALDVGVAALRPGFSGLSGAHYSGAKYLSLQEALWDRGLFVYVPAGVDATIPLSGRVTCSASGIGVFPRTIVVVEEGASLTYIDEYDSPTETELKETLSHARVELHCKPGARLHYVNIQRWHAGVTHLFHQHANLANDSALTAVTITLGGGTTKATVEAALQAPGATSYLFGLGFANGKQHFDHHTMQTHLAPHTTSDLLYKIALKDQAKSIYTGLIRMTKAAQQSNAYQANRNLLLSEAARANTVPQLEIEANDVRCTHGATVGTIDEEQCYYLTSRGLSREEAEQMIAAGLFEELLLRLPSEHVREVVRKTIQNKLGG